MVDRNDREVISMVVKGFRGFFREERRQGEALGTLTKTLLKRTLTFQTNRTFGQELHLRARRHPHKIFIDYGPERWTYAEMDEQAGRVARGLKETLPDRGCVGVMAGNSPEFLHAFFATQKAGLTCVPINTGLKSDGLAHILDNAEVDVLFVDADLYEAVRPLQADRPRIRRVVAIERKARAPRGVESFENFLDKAGAPLGAGVDPDPETPSLLMYTSGTTGHPKGVSYRYGGSQARLMRFSAHLLVNEDDIYYTCLPLFHANALMVTTLQALYGSARVVLSERFSASRLWAEVRASGATLFNTLGSMIAILMKQPPSKLDPIHNVRLVWSAACPRELWEPFQKRFQVHLVEGYGAVDGGGFLTLNMGSGPAGSIGKSMPGMRYRLLDDDGKDVGVGQPGELVTWVGKWKDRQVSYHRNPEASREKCRDGWVYSGDLLSRDERGYLYFIGRKTDSMRRRGENISAAEIESAAAKHPDVLECAAFGVPSELGEEEVMIAVVPVEGKTIDPAGLVTFLEGHLARYALPRYVEVVEDLPKTETHRVQKNTLKVKGVTAATWDREKAERVGKSA
ncbi:MAG: AMP-binding protein [Nitrospirae bacterium]|nr:AMP-binding protein [Nitrospirota bacterium]